MRPDLYSIILPILKRTADHLKNNSPTQNTLKFLDMMLKEFKEVPEDACPIYMDLLNAFVQYISFAIYEDVFPIFDKLLTICSPILNEGIFLKCLSILIERYSFKNKAQKASLQGLTKTLIEV